MENLIVMMVQMNRIAVFFIQDYGFNFGWIPTISSIRDEKNTMEQFLVMRALCDMRMDVCIHLGMGWY